ncbi:MAG TPA: hypothetical protein VHS52_10470 [Acidimicrobiales bacterium]|nr:hypothetical protein [Acidimicrobiales bacterium]
MTGPLSGPQGHMASCTAIDGGLRVRQTLPMRRQWPALPLAGASSRAGDVSYRQARSGALGRAS